MDSKPLGVCETLSMVFFFFLKSHCILSLSYGIKYLYVSMVSLVITGEKDLACSLVCNEYGEKNRTFENLACSLGMQLKSSFLRTLDLGELDDCFRQCATHIFI